MNVSPQKVGGALNFRVSLRLKEIKVSMSYILLICNDTNILIPPKKLRWEHRNKSWTTVRPKLIREYINFSSFLTIVTLFGLHQARAALLFVCNPHDLFLGLNLPVSTAFLGRQIFHVLGVSSILRSYCIMGFHPQSFIHLPVQGSLK